MSIVIILGVLEGGKRKTILPHFSSCESLCGYSHIKNSLSFLLARSGSSVAYSLPVFLFASVLVSAGIELIFLLVAAVFWI